MRRATSLLFRIIVLPGLTLLTLFTQLYATPPDVVETRETIIGANDSLMAFYELRTGNKGSHYINEEELTFVLREISTRKDLIRTVVSRVEYLYDFDTDEIVRHVRESNQLDLAAVINENNLSLPVSPEWELPVAMEGKRMVSENGEGERFLLLEESEFLNLFDYNPDYPEDLKEMEFKVVRTYSCYGSEWDFVEVATVSEDFFNATTRIIPILQSSRLAPIGDEQGSLWESWNAIRWITSLHTV